MFTRTLVAAAALLLLPAFARAQEGLEAQVKELEKAIGALRLTPGLSLKVNGETVPPEAWQRTLVYLKGRAIIEERIILFIIDERIDELAAEEVRKKKAAQVEPAIQARLKEAEAAFLKENPGKSWDEHLQSKDSSRADLLMEWREKAIGQVKLADEAQILDATRKKLYSLSEDKVQARIKMTIKEFQQKNPDQDFWQFIQRSGYTRKEYVAIVRSTLLFNRLFFDGKPWDWPAITKEAIYNKAGDKGKEFFDSIVKNIRENPKSQVPPFFIGIFQKWVLASFKEWADIRYASDGLEPGSVISYNGRKYSTMDAYRRIKSKISSVEKNRALREIVLITALRQALVKAKVWPSPEDFKKDWKVHCKPYEGSPFNIQVIATSFKGYPSMEAYKHRFRLMEGYRRLLESKELYTDKQLKEFLPEVTPFLGEGAVDTELIRFPARDDQTGAWIPGGYAAAKAQADMVMSALENGSMTFAQARKLGKWNPTVKHGGVLSHKTRNEFRRELGESEYHDFVFGYSIGDLLFEKAPEGKVIGPLCGLDGYYVARVVKRYAPKQSVSLADGNMKEMVKQEYLTRRFLRWANEVAVKTQID